MKTKQKHKDVWQVLNGSLYLDRGSKSWWWYLGHWIETDPWVWKYRIITRAEAKRRFPDAFKKLPY